MKQINTILIISIITLLMLLSIGLVSLTEARPSNDGPQPLVVTYITNIWELQNVSSGLAGDYALSNNISANITLTWNAGAGFDPIGDSTHPFTGTFDGQNYTITDLYINRPLVNYVGMFAVNNNLIKNTHLINANITGLSIVGGLAGSNGIVALINCSSVSGRISGAIYSGGLVGVNYYHVYNSYTSVNMIGITGGGNGDNIGGLIGANNNLYDEGMYVGGAPSVSQSYSIGNVSGRWYVGGFIGNQVKGEINNCYSNCTTTGGVWYVGGFAGQNDGYINMSYAVGDIDATDFYGGFAGVNTLTVSTSYYDTDISGLNDTGKGAPKTTDEMKTQVTFASWDFEDVWGIQEDETYPYFVWQDILEDEEIENATVNTTSPTNNETDYPSTLTLFETLYPIIFAFMFMLILLILMEIVIDNVRRALRK